MLQVLARDDVIIHARDDFFDDYRFRLRAQGSGGKK